MAASGVVGEGQTVPGVLTYQAILAACGLDQADPEDHEGTGGPIEPCLKRNVRTASYDLRLGKEYYVKESDGGTRSLKTRSLAEGEGIVLAPSDVVIITALETVRLGNDMIGRLSLKMDRLLDGMIMAPQSQIDAGYEGEIFALLYNLSDRERTLKQGASVLRLELECLPEPSDKSYSGDYQQESLSGALREPLGSSLQGMRHDIDELRSEATQAQTEDLSIGGVETRLPRPDSDDGNRDQCRRRQWRLGPLRKLGVQHGHDRPPNRHWRNDCGGRPRTRGPAELHLAGWSSHRIRHAAAAGRGSRGTRSECASPRRRDGSESAHRDSEPGSDRRREYATIRN